MDTISAVKMIRVIEKALDLVKYSSGDKSVEFLEYLHARGLRIEGEPHDPAPVQGPL